MNEVYIRNFCIIAHIDHGKSTLADRFLEITGTVDTRHMQEQYLDQLELERERGITIKMAPVRMRYHPHRRMTQNDTRNDAESKLLYETITYEIRGAAFEVRKRLGLGHKEIVYHNALAEEFKKRNLRFESEKNIGIFYDGKKIGSYQPDFIIEEKILIELKALPEIGRPQTEQLWSYLKGSDYKLALLINFGTKTLDIQRVVYDTAREIPRDSASLPRPSAQVEEYILNLIDTPGHSDFSYEVSRALAAVEGGILLVDATQGIQAQTLANLHLARSAGLTIIGAVNKIDILEARGDTEGLARIRHEVAELLNISDDEIMMVSAKTGEGVSDLLRVIIERIPSPVEIETDQRASAQNQRVSAAPARALIFDSFYDDHKGVIASVRVFEGTVNGTDIITLAASGASSKIKEVGFFAPPLTATQKLGTGEIGYIATGIKDIALVKIGDTIVSSKSKCQNPKTFALHGYQEPQPVVFVSFYPEDNDEYDLLKRSFDKLRLNDSALHIEPDQNEVLGRGFKVGFLGHLHFEITAERLRREFHVTTVSTFPSVLYKVKTRGGWIEIVKPEEIPEEYEAIWEPMVKIVILTSPEFLNNIYPLQNKFRFSNIMTETFQNQTEIKAIMPLAELVSDFDDQLKSATAGYASFSYELADYMKADIVKIDIAIAGEIIPGLSRFFPKSTLQYEARELVERLKKTLPQQQFAQPIQAKDHGKVIAREDIPALRKELGNFGKNGGDRTRKMKLWQKQKKGKERLKARAHVRIPPHLFKELLKK